MEIEYAVDGVQVLFLGDDLNGAVAVPPEGIGWVACGAGGCLLGGGDTKSQNLQVLFRADGAGYGQGGGLDHRALAEQ